MTCRCITAVLKCLAAGVVFLVGLGITAWASTRLVVVNRSGSDWTDVEVGCFDEPMPYFDGSKSMPVPGWLRHGESMVVVRGAGDTTAMISYCMNGKRMELSYYCELWWFDSLTVGVDSDGTCHE